MPIPETDELRTLQQKAYGRSGGLTDAEAARLRELERPSSSGEQHPSAARGSEVGEGSPIVERGVEAGEENLVVERGSEATETKRAPVPRRRLTDESSPGSDSPAVPSIAEDLAWRAALRRHWKAASAASALLALIGLGAGWALFAPRVHDAVQLTDAEVQRKLELDEKSSFDEGTLRAVARDADALVWFGTKDDGAQLCLVLDVADQSQMGCTRADEINSAFGLTATVTLPPEDDAPDGDFGASINAYAMMSTAGEPMVNIQRWDNDSSVLDQFEGEERARAQELLDEGYLAGVTLVGYVREQPAWIANRFTETGENERCLIVDSLGAVVCALESATLEDGLTIVSEDEDGLSLHVSAQFTTWGFPYLTVTESARASTTVIDTETGDPIEVTTPTDPGG